MIASLDTWIPLSDNEQARGLGGLRLQGVDDNASGLGVMLELAKQLSHKPLHYGVRFVALSASESHLHGMDDYVARMSEKEKKNTLLVIDLNSLITGDHLYFNSGMNTPRAVRKQTSERALLLARRFGISAASRQLTKMTFTVLILSMRQVFLTGCHRQKLERRQQRRRPTAPPFPAFP